jgi:hypothetical protein
MTSLKRRISVASIFALVAGVLALSATISPASAGTAVNTNACQNSATGTFADVPITTTGTGAPNPATLGIDTVSLTGTNYAAFFDAAVLVAGYNLGLLIEGVNNIPGELNYTLNASNTVEGSVTFPPIPLLGQTTITDPDGTPGTGDEIGTDLAVSVVIPDTVWTPSGGDIEFSDGGAIINASVAGGLITVGFTCQVGTSTPAGCALDPLTDCTGADPAPAIPFETVTVFAPPAPPVCANGGISVGLTQTTTIDLNTLCTDQNGAADIDQSSWVVTAGSANGTVTVDGAGVATYTSLTDPGVGGDSFTFSVSDIDQSHGLGPSNTGTVSVSVLANTCDATAGPCSLSQITFFPVIGTTMTFTQANAFCDTVGEVNGFDDNGTPGDPSDDFPIVQAGAIGCQNVALSPVVLNGTPQLSVGTLNDLTVTNARGTAAGWAVTAYTTDFGNEFNTAVADFDGPGPAPAVPACSTDAVLLSGGLAGAPDRNCISGNNMGYAPYAIIDHTQIPGDVATVTAGAASAANAAAWLAELACSAQDIDAGAVGTNGAADATINDGVTDTTTGVLACFNGGTNGDGLAGYTGNPAAGGAQSLICSAATDVSGGTFGCDADLWMGVPASAGAGLYGGQIILTLT